MRTPQFALGRVLQKKFVYPGMMEVSWLMLLVEVGALDSK